MVEQLKQEASEGFKSVLNLRSPSETGFLADEQQQAQAANLHYINIPLSSSEVNAERINEAIEKIDNLPKPILIHCAAGARASGIALIAAAIAEGLSYEQIVGRAKEIDVNLDQPHLKQFLLEKLSEKQIDS